jgi:hypothetical protein
MYLIDIYRNAADRLNEMNKRLAEAEVYLQHQVVSPGHFPTVASVRQSTGLLENGNDHLDALLESMRARLQSLQETITEIHATLYLDLQELEQRERDSSEVSPEDVIF